MTSCEDRCKKLSRRQLNGEHFEIALEAVKKAPKPRKRVKAGEKPLDHGEERLLKGTKNMTKRETSNVAPSRRLLNNREIARMVWGP